MDRFTNVDPTPTRLPPVYAYQTHPLLPLRQALDPVVSQINSLDEYIKIAKRECHFPSEHGLNRDESASIYIYTMDWGKQSLYRVLNALLRNKDRRVLVPWYYYLKLFDAALKKLPSVQTSLWRGINMNITKNYSEDQELTWWAISSCSSSLNAVKHFLGPISTLMMIEAKNGKSISTYSNFPDENEVILGLGTHLRVKSDVLDHASMNVVHLLELNDDDENNEKLSLSVTIVSIARSDTRTLGE